MVFERDTIANIDVKDVWSRLAANKSAQLIDVRTPTEWSGIGIPDLAELRSDPILVEWPSIADAPSLEAFAADLETELKARGVSRRDELFFICRSGARSAAAARVMAAAGYSSCYNVAEGFEGPADQTGNRGTIAGWQAAGLPWTQG